MREALTTKEFILRRLRCFPRRRDNIQLNFQLRSERHLFTNLDDPIDFVSYKNLQDEDRWKGLNKDLLTRIQGDTWSGR